MNNWSILIASLPTGNATTRMRIWRALKGAGAAVIRDGVYLLPADARTRTFLESLRTEVRADGGSALVLDVSEPDDAPFAPLFDRTNDFRKIDEEVANLTAGLDVTHPDRAVKEVRRLRKMFSALSEIDFFPGAAQMHSDSLLREAEQKVSQRAEPSEPEESTSDIERLHAVDYQQRLWATRHRPWVDRLASAWLIRRFIDPQAEFLWLQAPSQCPAHAIGFDFDGAQFSHVGDRVTFEVLLTSFDLQVPGLRRIGAIVHALDVGGAMPAEAAGIECVLAGLREQTTSDDALLASTNPIFDALFEQFGKQENEKH
jgi:hypothetical protein